MTTDIREFQDQNPPPVFKFILGNMKWRIKN